MLYQREWLYYLQCDVCCVHDPESGLKWHTYWHFYMLYKFVNVYLVICRLIYLCPRDLYLYYNTKNIHLLMADICLTVNCVLWYTEFWCNNVMWHCHEIDLFAYLFHWWHNYHSYLFQCSLNTRQKYILCYVLFIIVK